MMKKLITGIRRIALIALLIVGAYALGTVLSPAISTHAEEEQGCNEDHCDLYNEEDPDGYAFCLGYDPPNEGNNCDGDTKNGKHVCEAKPCGH
ncbi:MAG: hypothetical protein OXE92_03720 [Bacteroidetes bacterium]|nr:hypothetical protein [Bacteroidota bacterium]